MISVIDMPPPEETIWWRGKRGFEVGFFPCECVEVIGDKVPHNLNLPHNANTLPHISRRDSSSSDSPSEPTKPVLRKHGKLITFFRSFILSRPARGKLKKSGILKERVFGCDLGEHLLNTGQDGKQQQASSALNIDLFTIRVTVMAMLLNATNNTEDSTKCQQSNYSKYFDRDKVATTFFLHYGANKLF